MSGWQAPAVPVESWLSIPRGLAHLLDTRCICNRVYRLRLLVGLPNKSRHCIHDLKSMFILSGIARWWRAWAWHRQRPRSRRPHVRSTSGSTWTAGRSGLSSRTRPLGWPRGCAPSRLPGLPLSRAARQAMYHPSRHAFPLLLMFCSSGHLSGSSHVLYSWGEGYAVAC